MRTLTIREAKRRLTSMKEEVVAQNRRLREVFAASGVGNYSLGMGVLKDVGWAPFAPLSLIASTVSSTQIDLSWADTNRNESGYRIEHATNSGGPWILVQTTPANTTSWSDTGLTPSTTYFYRVRAFHALGESLDATASATTNNPTAVSLADFSAIRQQPGSLQIHWSTATEMNLVGFNLYRSQDPAAQGPFSR